METAQHQWQPNLILNYTQTLVLVQANQVIHRCKLKVRK